MLHITYTTLCTFDTLMTYVISYTELTQSIYIFMTLFFIYIYALHITNTADLTPNYKENTFYIAY